VAPRPIGAAQSISDRSLFVLAAIGSPRSFFGDRANPARRYRFTQRVLLQAELLRDFAQAHALDQKAFDLSHHAGRQNRGSSRGPRRIEALRAPFPIELDRALDADRRHPEGPDDVALPRMSVGAKLTRYHPKGGDVVLGMDEHRDLTVEIRDLAVSPFKRQFVGDGRDPGGKHRQMKLRHEPSPGSSRANFAPPRDHSRIRPIPSPIDRREPHLLHNQLKRTAISAIRAFNPKPRDQEV